MRAFSENILRNLSHSCNLTHCLRKIIWSLILCSVAVEALLLFNSFVITACLFILHLYECVTLGAWNQSFLLQKYRRWLLELRLLGSRREERGAISLGRKVKSISSLLISEFRKIMIFGIRWRLYPRFCSLRLTLH